MLSMTAGLRSPRRGGFIVDIGRGTSSALQLRVGIPAGTRGRALPPNLLAFARAYTGCRGTAAVRVSEP
jgi:hypothetical protein